MGSMKKVQGGGLTQSAALSALSASRGKKDTTTYDDSFNDDFDSQITESQNKVQALEEKYKMWAKIQEKYLKGGVKEEDEETDSDDDDDDE